MRTAIAAGRTGRVLGRVRWSLVSLSRFLNQGEKLGFRDASELDVYGWPWLTHGLSWAGCFTTRWANLGSIMSVQIEWEGGVPDIYAAMSGDREAFIRVARLLWGDGFVDGIVAESNKKVQRVEDILDDRDPLERIEQRLDGLLTAVQHREASSTESPYLTTKEAAGYLKSTVPTIYDWVKRGKLHPVPGRRGLFTKEALDRFAQTRRRRKK